MRNSYLEPFTDVADRSDVVEIFGASCGLAKATPAVAWDGSVEDIEPYLIDLHHGLGGM